MIDLKQLEKIGMERILKVPGSKCGNERIVNHNVKIIKKLNLRGSHKHRHAHAYMYTNEPT